MGDFDDYEIKDFIESVYISKYDSCYVLTHITQNVCFTGKYVFLLIFSFDQEQEDKEHIDKEHGEIFIY
jgi:hypothetical protein